MLISVTHRVNTGKIIDTFFSSNSQHDTVSYCEITGREEASHSTYLSANILHVALLTWLSNVFFGEFFIK